MRFLVLLVGLIVLVSGCGDDGDRAAKTEEAEKAYALVMSSSAADAGREAGVDLDRLVRRSAEKALARLPHRGRVRIEVNIDAAHVIPEIGVGGSTGFDGAVSISLELPLRASLSTEIPPTLAHELHHSSRIRTGPGFGVTLGEALVSEGLADHFAEEVFPTTPLEPWDNALSREQEASLWQRAKPQLEIPGYDYKSWFFGGSGIPRWTGYTLGYRIVAAYLGDKRRASDAVGVEASTIIAPYAKQRDR